MSLHIRRYVERDYERVLEMHYSGLNQHHARIDDARLDQDMHQVIPTYLEAGGDFLVGESEGQIVCIGAYRRKDQDTAEIKRIRVDQAYQRRGYGQAILTALEKSIKDKGFRHIVLDTTTKQTSAMSMYVKNGYMEVRRKTFGGMEIVFFEKNLS